MLYSVFYHICKEPFFYFTMLALKYTVLKWSLVFLISCILYSLSIYLPRCEWVCSSCQESNTGLYPEEGWWAQFQESSTSNARYPYRSVSLLPYYISFPSIHSLPLHTIKLFNTKWDYVFSCHISLINYFWKCLYYLNVLLSILEVHKSFQEHYRSCLV